MTALEFKKKKGDNSSRLSYSNEVWEEGKKGGGKGKPSIIVLERHVLALISYASFTSSRKGKKKGR